jgi:hypothetical protein
LSRELGDAQGAGLPDKTDENQLYKAIQICSKTPGGSKFDIV